MEESLIRIADAVDCMAHMVCLVTIYHIAMNLLDFPWRKPQ